MVCSSITQYFVMRRSVATKEVVEGSGLKVRVVLQNVDKSLVVKFTEWWLLILFLVSLELV